MFASDCFVLPSLYEGLPVVGIEAQYAGLPCVFSNRITHEAIISNQTFLEDIREESGWCNRILNFKQKRMQICNDKFNINNISNEILNKYIEYDKK